MKALWLEDRSLALRDLRRPSVPAEALIRIRLAGICSTDLELAAGYYPFTGVPGHEFVGEVVEAPDPAWVGRRVVGEINAVCGTCGHCRGGRQTHCAKRTVLGIVGRDGALAQYTTLPLASLHRVPDALSDEQAVFTEPLAAALEILEQVAIRPGDRVLLLGAGRLGQLAARTLAPTGCDLSVVARHPRQRDLLAAQGIRVLAAGDLPAAHWDVVVEATGSGEGFALGLRAVRPRGTLVLKSTYRGSVDVDLSAIVVDEVTIVGSRCGPFPPALRLLESGRLDPTDLIDAEFPLDKAVEAFACAAGPGTLKVLVRV